MNSIWFGLIVFAAVFGSALLGSTLRSIVAERHLNDESRDVLKLGIGLVGTMAALVLGLLLSTANSSYDRKRSEVIELGTNFIVLDRLLDHYGPEAAPARTQLREIAQFAVARIWADSATPAPLSGAARASGDAMLSAILSLAPSNDAQRSIAADVRGVFVNLARTRLQLMGQASSSIPIVLLIFLVVWLGIIFAGFGLLAPRNITVFITLLFCALCVSAAIFLILELDRPFQGIIEISSAPITNALEQLK